MASYSDFKLYICDYKMFEEEFTIQSLGLIYSTFYQKGLHFE